MSNTRSSRRIHFLDELRGFCVILMVFYHAFYTIGYMYSISFCQTLFEFFEPAEPIFAGLFVFICGLSCNLSRNNLKRGILLAVVSAALSFALWLGIRNNLLHPGSQIWFGVLHCLAACILLYTLFYPTIRFVPAWLGFILCAILFTFCYHIPSSEGGYFGIQDLFTLEIPTAELNDPFLYAFGLCPVGIAGDYFPLLPWFFCFLAGSYVGSWHRRFPKWMFRRHVPFLAQIGKWALWIYLLHQPIIYGIGYAVHYIVKAI